MITFDSGAPSDIIPPWADQVLSLEQYPSASKPKDCKDITDFGELAFVIGGKDYIYPAKDWVKIADKTFSQKNHKANIFGPKLLNKAVA